MENGIYIVDEKDEVWDIDEASGMYGIDRNNCSSTTAAGAFLYPVRTQLNISTFSS